MIDIDGYDSEKMDEIGHSLIEGYIAQTEIEDVDEYVNKNAPPIFLEYLKEYRAARDRMKAEGILA